MNKKNLEERNKKILEEYLDNKLTLKQIGEKYGISASSVTRLARINKVSRRNGSETFKITEEQEQEIISLYNQNNSLLSIQRKMKKDYNSIIDILNKNNLVPKTRAKLYNPDFIENYFENIDTSNKAYWLGWLISDGNIDEDGTISISLNSEDEEILHLFENDLKVKDKVRTVNEYKRFAIGSQIMLKDLLNLTVTPNKSFTVKLPELDGKLYPHLLRGLFDGDGWISVYTGTHFNKKTNKTRTQEHIEVGFCGNFCVISKVKQILENAIPNLKKKKVESENSIFRIRWGSKKDIQLLYQYLYQDSDIHYLKRKKTLFESLEIIQANSEVN